MKSDILMRLNNLFPSRLNADADIISALLPLSSHAPLIRGCDAILFGEEIATGCRLYNDWPATVPALSEIQSKMLRALYTKHCDGFVREKYLRAIIGYDEDWVPPFVLSLLGEYVIEIVSIIDDNKELLAKKTSYISFINANHAYLNLIESRCTSYWDCYYRFDYHRGAFIYKDKAAYPGIGCLNYLRQHAQKAA